MGTKEAAIRSERKRPKAITTIFAAAGLLIAGCAANSELVGATSSPAPIESSPSDHTSTTEPLDVRLIFDDLGVGEPTIHVYPGVSNSVRDKLESGTYKDGDSVYAECRTKGRFLPPPAEVREAGRPYDDWIRFHNSSGIGPYATATYVENPDALLAKLPEC